MASLPRPSIRRAPGGTAGAGPAPTAVIRPPSHTMWPSANSRRSASTVAIAQPSMTVVVASRARGIYSLRRSTGSTWTPSTAWTTTRSWRGSAACSRSRRGSAERAWAARPFGSVDALHEAMVEVVERAPRDVRLALIRAHPDLAGEACRCTRRSPSASRPPPGSTALTPEQYERITWLTAAYRERFGFPFVVCAREHTADSIIAAAERADRSPTPTRRSRPRCPRSPRSPACGSTTWWRRDRRAHQLRQARGAGAVRRRAPLRGCRIRVAVRARPAAAT